MNELIKIIREACYYIPGKYMQDTPSGIPYAYTQGLIAGRQQALEILEKHNG